MSPQEFKNEFLLEYDSHASNTAPGLNDYMISYWLTASENQLVKDYLTPKSNRRMEGFEMTETRRRKLAHLVTPQVIPFADGTKDPLVNINVNSLIFDTTAFRIQEIKSEYLVVAPSECNELGQIEIVPITHDEYTQLIKNPFRKPSEKLAWRLDLGAVDTNLDAVRQVEIITSPGLTFTSYNMRYVKRPFPIIVGDLTLLGPNISIEGETQVATCKLDEQFHREVVYRAVTNALESVSNPRFQSHMVQDQMQIE
jgi:hypothetical protein